MTQRIVHLIARLPRDVVVLLLRLYRAVISPLYGPTCRFYPSCSEYALIAVGRHGVVRGGGLSAWRLLRCNPWNQGGVDLVPVCEGVDSVPSGGGAGHAEHTGGEADVASSSGHAGHAGGEVGVASSGGRPGHAGPASGEAEVASSGGRPGHADHAGGEADLVVPGEGAHRTDHAGCNSELVDTHPDPSSISAAGTTPAPSYRRVA